MKEIVANYLLRKEIEPTVFRVSLIVAIFIAILVCLSLLHYVTISVSEGVRSYVRGEGLWAKAQTKAVLHLIDYSYTQESEAFEQYKQSIEVMLGDKAARIALSQDVPDLETARKGFLAGQNDPEDVGHLIDFFLYFEHFPYMSEAIEIWHEADGKIAELISLADTLKRAIEHDRPQHVVAGMRNDLIALNVELHALEYNFSSVLFAAQASWLP